MDFKKLANQYKSELLDSVMPFWVGKSQDKEYGGYFSCLDNAGNVYDTDKFVWMQGREVWMFSMLYNKVERRKEWLDGVGPHDFPLPGRARYCWAWSSSTMRSSPAT